MTLKRISSDRNSTYGVLIDNTIPFAVTLEPSWNNNKSYESCIPAGIYSCKRIISTKFGNTFAITNVPDRTNIRFHKGNFQSDTEGCILIAEQFEQLGDKTAILQSKKGFDEFMDKLIGVNGFSLVIISV